MSSDFPMGMDEIPPVVDGDLITAAQQNQRSDAINAIETTLGTNPAGASATVGAAIATRAPLDSPAMIGTPTAPTAAPDTNTTQLATTAFVQAALLGDVVAADITVVASGFTGNLSSTDTDVQTALGTIDAMTVEGSGMANPMTAAGDLIVGVTDGDPDNLPIGDEGQVLTVVSGAPAWSAPASAMTLIGQAIAEGDNGTLNVGSIPGTYSQITIVFQGRGDANTNTLNVYPRFNGDNGSNYVNQYAGGAGGSSTAGRTTLTRFIDTAVPAATSTAGRTSTFIAQVPGYANGFHKSVLTQICPYNYESLQVYSANTSWASTDPITSVSVSTESGNFVAGSSLTVYGIA